jgi:ATP-dependent Clp protease protease subunit
MSRVPVATMSVTPLRPKQAKQPPARKDAPGYRMAKSGGDRGEIFLYGLIGISSDNFFGIDGITAKDFAEDLRALGQVKSIDLRINSDGGVIDDARAIYNLLVSHPATIATHIDGIAASAASFVAMAGRTVEMAEGGFLMIHNARGGMYGTADDFAKAVDVFRSYDEQIRKTYAARTGRSDAELKGWMDEETWFTAEEAKANGFVDTIVENMKAAAVAPSRLAATYRHRPNELLPRRAAAVAKIAALRRS